MDILGKASLRLLFPVVFYNLIIMVILNSHRPTYWKIFFQFLFYLKLSFFKGRKMSQKLAFKNEQKISIELQLNNTLSVLMLCSWNFAGASIYINTCPYELASRMVVGPNCEQMISTGRCFLKTSHCAKNNYSMALILINCVYSSLNYW